MKRIGIRGLQNFDGALDTPQIVEKRLGYGTPEWQDAFRYAVHLAEELGLEFAIASSPGWSETGGPWVKPEDAMKKLVWSTIEVSGGRRFCGRLPQPPSISGPFQNIATIDATSKQPRAEHHFYRDWRVIAYRSPRSEPDELNPIEVTANDSQVDISALIGDHFGHGSVEMRCSEEKPAWVLFDYGRSMRVRAATLGAPSGSMVSFSWALEASEDGENFRHVAEFPRDYYVFHTTITFPTVAARYVRLSINHSPLPEPFDAGANAPGALITNSIRVPDRVTLNELRMYGVARVHCFELKAGFGIARGYYALDNSVNECDEAVAPEDVIDITDKMDANGELSWDPPAGDWTVLRLGYSLTGKTNHPASPEATGLEVDKLDAQAVKAYLAAYLAIFERVVGNQWIGKKGIRGFVTDSIESLGQNWTPALINEFKSRHGYDPMPWLPTLTGVIVGDGARSDRFLWDFRKTLMELMTEAHYAQIAATVHERGLIYYAESLEGYPFMALGDDLDMRRHADVPMAAIWTSYRSADRDGLSWHIADIRGAASVAHVFGKRLVAAECLTSTHEPWAFSPATLRPFMDLAFALGVNRPIIHTSVHQPAEMKPGISLGPYGQNFNRHETWAEFAEPWVTYLARSSYLLQQGGFVADVAWFYGEEGSLSGVYAIGEPTNLPQGYGFDFVNANMILNDLRAEGGRLVSSGGASYRLLYLGAHSERMTLAVLRKIKQLSDLGVAIAGPRPVGSPSLSDERKEEEYQTIVKELWERERIWSCGDPNRVLGNMGVVRDFDYEMPEPDTRVMFLHRRLLDGEIYFLSNRKPRPECIEARFRVTGRKPELWHADYGRREEVSWRIDGEHTVVPLKLRGNGSVFVIFRKPTLLRSEELAEPNESVLLRIQGSWQLSFQSNRGAPDGPLSTELGSWTESPVCGVRYFSGVGTYRKTFSLARSDLEGDGRLILDLGGVHELAEVSVNRHVAGTAWCAPFEVDLTGAVRPGENSLVIRVANVWANRLIGDQQPGAVPVAFTTTKTYGLRAPLRVSGLLGPVVLKRRTLR